MIPSVTQRPRARLDLLNQYVYFAEQADVLLAERYFAAVDKTCLHLLTNPQSGARFDCRLASLEGLRRFPVRGFENYLIFYLPQEHGIEVVRVLHGNRDIDGLLATKSPRVPQHDS